MACSETSYPGSGMISISWLAPLSTLPLSVKKRAAFTPAAEVRINTMDANMMKHGFRIELIIHLKFIAKWPL